MIKLIKERLFKYFVNNYKERLFTGYREIETIHYRNSLPIVEINNDLMSEFLSLNNRSTGLRYKSITQSKSQNDSTLIVFDVDVHGYRKIITRYSYNVLTGEKEYLNDDTISFSFEIRNGDEKIFVKEHLFLECLELCNRLAMRQCSTCVLKNKQDIKDFLGTIVPIILNKESVDYVKYPF